MTSRKIEIAICDDDKITLFLFSKLVTELSLPITTCEYMNGQELMNDVTKKHIEGRPLPDVLILDLYMPILDGWGVLDQLKKMDISPDKLPIIYICSSSYLNEDIEQAKRYDIVKDFITKPLRLNTLKEIAEKSYTTT